MAFMATMTVAMCCLRAEWENDHFVLGPLLLAKTGFSAGWVLAAILLPTVCLCFLKPHPVTIRISAVAIMVWILLGLIGLLFWAAGC
jgi:hypothetical protein